MPPASCRCLSSFVSSFVSSFLPTCGGLPQLSFGHIQSTNHDDNQKPVSLDSLATPARIVGSNEYCNGYYVFSELPKILHMARNAKKYPTHDQEMLNWYNTEHTKDMFKLLPMHYNWKAYWGLEPSDFSEVKILHFHGPKLGRGLEEMSACNISAVSPEFRIEPYTPHIQQGICCDQGRTAGWSLEAIDNLKAPIEDLCEVNK